MPNLEPGQTFGAYTIISELAAADSLLAYKAYSSALTRDVRLEVLSPALAQSDAARARFRQAAHALLNLKHPHVLAAHDIGEIEGQPYVALQDLAALTLAERAASGPLSLAEVTRILGQLADALTYLQANGVTLGTLDPTKILLDEHGDVFLADVGLANAADSAATNSEPLTSAYTLGTLLSALVAGHDGASLSDALQRLTDALPAQRRADVAAAFERVIHNATAASEGERFTSAADLLAAWHQAAALMTDAPTTHPTLDASSLSALTTPPAMDAAHARTELDAQIARFTQTETLRRLLRTIELVALKRSQQEMARLKRHFEAEEAARSAQLSEMPRAQLAQEVVSSIPAVTVRRTRSLITRIVIVAAILVCGVPALCFICVALLPDSSAKPTPTLAAVGIATRTPTARAVATAAVRATLAAPTRAPSPAPTLNATVVFTDEFATDNCTLLEGDNETRTFKCVNGEYTMLNKTSGSRWSYYDDEYEDSIVEVDAHAVSGPAVVEYGLVFRVASDGKSLYGFTLTRDGKFTVLRYEHSEFTDLLPYITSSAIKPNTASNRLKVIVQQDRISVFANDVFLASITDAHFVRGAVGLFVKANNPNAKAAFSHLRISTLNP